MLEDFPDVTQQMKGAEAARWPAVMLLPVTATHTLSRGVRGGVFKFVRQIAWKSFVQ